MNFEGRSNREELGVHILQSEGNNHCRLVEISSAVVVFYFRHYGRPTLRIIEKGGYDFGRR